MEVRVRVCENVDMKSVTGADSNSCGHVVKSLTWRDRRHNETEATNNIERKARRGNDNHQRDISKWQGYHGCGGALLRNDSGNTTVEK